jgi:hypothetical protein
MDTRKLQLQCPECNNRVHFVDINLSGFTVNFYTEPRTTITDVLPYENVCFICADCFDNGKYVPVGEKGQHLPTAVVEQAIHNATKRRLRSV